MAEHVGNYRETDRILRKYGLAARKKYGQNFLIDGKVPQRILREAAIGKADTVLEIGPGIGALTQYLAENAGCVTAVEIDAGLVQALGETLADYDNVNVVNADFLKFDLCGYFESLSAYGRSHFKIVGNLPYCITSPVIMKIIEGHVNPECLLFMVQSEVADRLLAPPGNADYGAMTLAASWYASLEKAGDVSPECFLPKPHVGSSLVRFLPYREKPVKTADEERMFRIIRASFNQRRKTLANGIANFAGLDFTRDRVYAALDACGLRRDVRGEQLSLAQFAAVTDALILSSHSGKE